MGNRHIKKEIKTIAITGIFGSGKSTVAKIFKKKGFLVIFCDEIVHKLLNEKQIIEKIKKEFGEKILMKKKIDRKKLADIIFKSNKKRKKLEKILHPLVFEKIKKYIDTNRKRSKIIIEIPLLFETKSESLFDCIIVVTASKNIIKERLKGKFTNNEIEKRWKNQIPLSKKIKKATYVIDNSRNLKDTKKQVEKVLKIMGGKNGK